MAAGFQVRQQSDKLVAELIKWATGNVPVEVRFEDDDDDEWSIITLYDYDGDKELSLRLHANDSYDLHIGYYDEEDEFIEVTAPLSDLQKQSIPEKLKKVMKKVLEDEKGLRVPGSLLK